MLLLGVDGGGTSCRARLADRDRTLGEGSGGPANLRLGLDESFQAVREAAEAALRSAGLGRERLRDTVACLGFAGAGQARVRRAAEQQTHPFRETLITTDVHIACVGAHGGRDGGVIVVGTGSCGLALLGGREHEVGGWGFPVSDEGSGAWLGLEVVRRTLWAHDGRRAWTPLLEIVFARFGRDPDEIVDWMTDAKPRDFASLAPLVVEHAREDPAGAELMRLAAGHIEALAFRLFDLGAPRLSLVGGLANPLAPWLSPELTNRLVPPEGDALAGALRLAEAHARSLGLA